MLENVFCIEIVQSSKKEKSDKMAKSISDLLKSLKRKTPTKSAESEDIIPKSSFNIDDSIAQLEKQLHDDSSDSSDSESDTDLESSSTDNDQKILKSSLDAERITPLPTKLLPIPLCSKSTSKSKIKNDEPKNTKIKFADEISKSDEPPQRSKRKVIDELFISYQPSAMEKLPLWCRACQKQSPDLASFEAHFLSEEHNKSAEAERRASYCPLCKKQLTSPEQLKEHFKGRVHREKAEKSGRAGRGWGRGGRGTGSQGRGEGRGRGGGGGAVNTERRNQTISSNPTSTLN